MTHVAREVGTEGQLGGQAVVPGVAGMWKELTDSVNSMAGNLTAQVRNIADGDDRRWPAATCRGRSRSTLKRRNPGADEDDQHDGRPAATRSPRGDARGARGRLPEGKLGGQASVPGVGGTWKDLTDSVNPMASNLTGQVRNIAEVTTAVANGDLSQKITVDVKGEILELKNTINTMVDQLTRLSPPK